jgi:hypothetical protein
MSPDQLIRHADNSFDFTGPRTHLARSCIHRGARGGAPREGCLIYCIFPNCALFIPGPLRCIDRRRSYVGTAQDGNRLRSEPDSQPYRHRQRGQILTDSHLGSATAKSAFHAPQHAAPLLMALTRAVLCEREAVG